MFCAHCGFQVNSEGKFCGSCGQPIGNRPEKSVSATITSKRKNWITGLYDGRIGRRDWIWGVVLSFIAVVVGIAVLAAMADSSDGGFFWFLIIVLYIAFFYFVFSLHARRLHDLNESGWKSLFFIIPLVNLITLVWLISTKGVDKDNKYGANTLDNGFFNDIFNR